MEVLAFNHRLPHFAKIHVISESAETFSAIRTSMRDSSKIVEVVRPETTFRSIFWYANSVLASDRGAITVFANADIQFDDTILCAERILKQAQATDLFGNRTILTLSRRNHPRCAATSLGIRNLGWAKANIFIDLCVTPGSSVDTWIIASPVPPHILESLDFHPFVWYADPNAAGRFNNGGWKTFNPCEVVHTFHLHCAPRVSMASHKLSDADPKLKKFPYVKSKHHLPSKLQVDCPRIIAQAYLSDELLKL
jgi:hypothetical protein